MIAADTNVLARFFLDDDVNQSKLAKEFIVKHTQNGTLYLSSFMLMELVWLLTSKGLGRHQIVPILDKLVNTDGIHIGQKPILLAALNLFRKHNISFSDCLITADADVTVNANTATFDQAMIKATKRCCIVGELC